MTQEKDCEYRNCVEILLENTCEICRLENKKTRIFQNSKVCASLYQKKSNDSDLIIICDIGSIIGQEKGCELNPAKLEINPATYCLIVRKQKKTGLLKT